MMNRHTVIHLLLVLFFIGAMIVCTVPSPGQDKTQPDEMKAEVPALDGFHSVIFKIWHDAWPSKNIQMLVGLLPEVEQGSDSVLNAQLPGILREKKAEWIKNTGALKSAVADYKAAASARDSVKLLAAAERLHSGYEKLVRTISPVLPEIENFHTTLYRIYHYEMPANDTAALAVSVRELAEKMTALNNAELPKRYEAKKGAFLKARKTLSKAVDDLAVTMAGGKIKEIRKKIQTMHTRYQALEKIFG